ncbi:MAG TPA: CPBP family glutamic-type intramembrane protease [Ktedonobacterales bacterium]
MSLPSTPAEGPRAPAPPEPSPPPRSTVRATWRWVWKDTAFRLVPFAAATAVYARFWGGGAAGVGIIGFSVPRDLLLGLAIGVPLAGAALVFRRAVAPRFLLPTAADQAFQTTFYLALNAPMEELFWRGTVQTLAVRAAELALGTGGLAAGAGWAATTAVFGAYHRLGSWSWRSIAGVTAAGGVFGLAYVLQPTPRSIWLPTIIHGLATAGFLSWGDAALAWWARRGGERSQ